MRHFRTAWPDSVSLVLTLLLVAVDACSQPAAPAKPAESSSAPTAAPAATQAPAAQAPAQSAPAQSATAGTPVEIRVGHGFAAEENLWLMAAKPDLAPNQGKAYRLAFTAFRGNADRLNAFEAGQLDLATVRPSTLFAAEQKRAVQARGQHRPREARRVQHDVPGAGRVGHSLGGRRAGKTVGIVDFKSATELWARAAIKGRPNPERDVNFVVVPFPAMGEALRANASTSGCSPSRS